MKILYIGDFLKKNGPSIVDINYKSFLSKDKSVDCEFYQSNFHWNLLQFFFLVVRSERIIFSGISFYAFLSLLIGVFFRDKKFFYICHGILKKEKNYSKVYWHRIFFEYFIFSRTNFIFSVSNLLKEEIKKYFYVDDGKIIVHHNGYDFSIIDDNLRDCSAVIKIFSVGGGRRQKGVLKACKAISLINRNISYIVAGEAGEDLDEIKEYKFVEYVGVLPRESLMNIYRNSDLYLILSDFDSFPTSFFEAFESGCKIISTKNVGAIEAFQDLSEKNIYIVEDEDLNSISKKIDEVIELPYSDVTEFIINRKKDFSWSKRSADLINILKNGGI